MNTTHTSARLDVLRPTQVRDVNVSAILRLLFAHGALPRSDIADHLGLTQGTVTRITNHLLQAGLISDLPRVTPSGRGRPRIPLAPTADSFQIIGVHIGVEHIRVGLMDLAGKPLAEERHNYDGSVDSALDLIAASASAYTAAATAPILGLGTILGGWVDPRSGIVRRHAFLDWAGIPLRELIMKRTGHRVFFESSVRAHAIADMVHGVARDCSSFIHVFVGNLVEVAVVLDGKLHRAPNGFGGAISEWPVTDDYGNPSTARQVLSDQAVVHRARDLFLIGAAEGFEDLVRYADENSQHAATARELLLTRAYRSGTLIAQLNALLAPDLIVVSSGVLYLNGSFEELCCGVDSSPLTFQRPTIRSGNAQENSVLNAAASIVLDRTLLDPASLNAILNAQTGSNG